MGRGCGRDDALTFKHVHSQLSESIEENMYEHVEVESNERVVKPLNTCSKAFEHKMMRSNSFAFALALVTTMCPLVATTHTRKNYLFVQ